MILQQKNLLVFIFSMVFITSFAQKSILRGYVFDKNGGQPIPYSNIIVQNANVGTTADVNGFYQMSNVPTGNYSVVVTSVGFDSVVAAMTFKENGIVNRSFYLNESEKNLAIVEVSSQREIKRETPAVSLITITPRQIKDLASVGGEPDIAQYLTVLPGIISTGDQGGQIFIRGGSPVQNKILLDGAVIYNPFHSIGFFSVFETETIRSADVYTGGFGAEYGDRISAVVDLKTREGNKTNLSGMASISPFMGKILLEGPLVRMKEENGSSISLLVTAKHSILPQTSKSFYKYATKDSVNGLPYAFDDIYAKLSFNAKGGSNINFFGFNFKDGVSYKNVADLNWTTRGYGTNFKLIPQGIGMIIGGNINYSNYDLTLQESDPDPRHTAISNFNVGIDFTIYGNNSELKYGAEVSGFQTDLSFKNPFGFLFTQNTNTTELGGFVKYRKKINRLVLEPSVRLQRYGSIGETSIEPRLAMKFNASDNFRLKFSGGLYSQNLISTVSEKDIVNLFVGYLGGPTEQFYKPGTNDIVDSRLQKATHLIGGIEWDANKNLSFNLEVYQKNYGQLIDINRTKNKNTDPNYAAETGDAHGVDLTIQYRTSAISVWATLSNAYVNIYDGTQTYPANFDRRNNVNLVTSFYFGKKRDWTLSGRWNYGSGFPFTQTQGFYGNYIFTGGIGTDVLTGNPNLGILYSDTRNGGRLPDYSRVDLSLKHNFAFGKCSGLDVTASVTNAQDRQNIFYFDRVNYKRVNQLPILPSFVMAVRF